MRALNQRAAEFVDEFIEFVDDFEVDIETVAEGVTVIDCGHRVSGGYEAGLLAIDIATGGLGSPQLEYKQRGGIEIPHLTLSSDHPAMGCFGAQRARIEMGEALISGPGQARLAFARDNLPEILPFSGQRDGEVSFEPTVLVYESEELPGPTEIDNLLEASPSNPEELFILAFPAASHVGVITAAARAGELALGRIDDLGGDIARIDSLLASAPIAPVGSTEGETMARTTDGLVYGASVHLRGDIAEETVREAVSGAAPEHGQSAIDLLEDGPLPARFCSPAQITVDRSESGPISVGRTDPANVLESFGYR